MWPACLKDTALLPSSRSRPRPPQLLSPASLGNSPKASPIRRRTPLYCRSSRQANPSNRELSHPDAQKMRRTAPPSLPRPLALALFARIPPIQQSGGRAEILAFDVLHDIDLEAMRQLGTGR